MISKQIFVTLFVGICILWAYADVDILGVIGMYLSSVFWIRGRTPNVDGVLYISPRELQMILLLFPVFYSLLSKR